MRIRNRPGAHLLALLLSATTFASETQNQSPNRPPGRIGTTLTPSCPLPGLLGIIPELPSALIQWSQPPSCFIASSTDPSDPSRVDCLFTSSHFRNGHGISIITSTTVMSDLISNEAFVDIPPGVVEKRRQGLGPAYKVVEIPENGKGKGIIATRKIKRGEIIMVDLPAVLVGMEYLAGTKPHHRRRLMKKAIEALPEETRRNVEGLQRGKGKYEVDRLFGINTHTVLVGGIMHVGLFKEVARINHSCRPNAYYRFSPDRLTMEIVSHVTIEPGDEIVLNYAPLSLTHTERRTFLLNTYSISCTCSLCSAPSHEIHDSEAARRNMEELRATMLDARQNKFYKDAITIAGDWLFYCEEEGLTPVMAEYHDIVADLYELKGDIKTAIRYARMALDGWVRLGSVDWKEVERARRVLGRLWERVEEGRGVGQIRAEYSVGS